MKIIFSLFFLFCFCFLLLLSFALAPHCGWGAAQIRGLDDLPLQLREAKKNTITPELDPCAREPSLPR